MQIAVKRILVATDYSAAAVMALDYACAIANKFGSELHILHVMEDPLPLVAPDGAWFDIRDALPALIRKATIFLGEHTKHLQLEPTVQVIRAVSVGYPSQEIHKYASEHDVDLIVLGTRGRQGLWRLTMGSVAEKTVRLATCPVLTTHYSYGQELKGHVPANIRTILVATDFSAAANRARDLAVSMATKFEADLHLLHAVSESISNPESEWMWTDPEGMWIRPEYDTPKCVEEASRKLSDNVAAIETEAAHPIIQTVRVGYPVDVIERYAAEQKVDLIVLGTQGHRGLAHLLLGSVAEKVVRLASCPVLTTH